MKNTSLSKETLDKIKELINEEVGETGFKGEINMYIKVGRHYTVNASVDAKPAVFGFSVDTSIII